MAWLPLTVQSISDRRLFSLSIPPPMAVPDELTWLLLMAELVIVAMPPVVLMPPPAAVAWLFVIVQEATFSVALVENAAAVDGGVAADRAVGQRGRAVP